MYEPYWNLRRKPFGGGCETALYYPGEGHQAALLKLRYAVESRHGAALLTGHAGVGKTMVVRLLAEKMGDGFAPPIHLTFPQMPAVNLLALLAAELNSAETPAGREPTIEQSVRLLQTRLLQTAQSGKHTTLVIDEAHLLEPRTFEALRLLLNTEHEGHPTLTLVLVGQPAILPLLQRLPQLEQRLAVKCLLRPLSLEETHAYVQHRLQMVGADRTIFDSAAVETLHAVAQGIPRDINRLCDLSLLIGFADEATTITAERIEAVAGELVNVSAE